MIDYFMKVLLMCYMFNSLLEAIKRGDVGALIWAVVFWSAYMWFYPVFRKKAQIKE